jgi:hypothetical protein
MFYFIQVLVLNFYSMDELIGGVYNYWVPR